MPQHPKPRKSRHAKGNPPVRRGRSDRGAALVEAAIVTPVLFLVLFAVFELGFVFSDYLSVSNASSEGARAASISGNVADTDFRILAAVNSAAAALPSGSIDRIVVFKATSRSTPVPPDCKTSTVPAVLTAAGCNLYFPADFNLTKSEFGCDPAANPNPDPDRFWCPADRSVSVAAGLDFAGVWIRVNHPYITGLFGTQITLQSTSVYQLEPTAK